MKYLGPPQSGSVAALVFSRNQFGQYTRARTAPTQPTGTFPTIVRGLFSTAVASWAALSNTQRKAWEKAEHRTTDSLGNKVILSGRPYFLQSSMNLTRSGFTALTLPGPPPVWHLTNLAVAKVSTNIQLTISSTGTARVIVYGLQPVSPAVMRPPGRYFWLFLVNLAVTAGTNTMNVTSNYTSRFAAPTSGKRIWIQIRELDVGTGIIGPVLRNFVDW